MKEDKNPPELAVLGQDAERSERKRKYQEDLEYRTRIEGIAKAMFPQFSGYTPKEFKDITWVLQCLIDESAIIP